MRLLLAQGLEVIEKGASRQLLLVLALALRLALAAATTASSSTRASRSGSVAGGSRGGDAGEFVLVDGLIDSGRLGDVRANVLREPVQADSARLGRDAVHVLVRCARLGRHSGRQHGAQRGQGVEVEPGLATLGNERA
jgi:hypothetical protein